MEGLFKKFSPKLIILINIAHEIRKKVTGNDK